MNRDDFSVRQYIFFALVTHCCFDEATGMFENKNKIKKHAKNTDRSTQL